MTSTLAYDTVVYSIRFLINIFFREIRPRGTWNIPRDGPIIFVAAPHHNQVFIALLRLSVPSADALRSSAILSSLHPR
jgi:glycerol-3-phosphate O-acyltransferase/dihydroxyacetone phosphate acyltransferase